jgi:Na+-translocating ferredoxin:NAD+ oxidoreductase RnfD subunit
MPYFCYQNISNGYVPAVLNVATASWFFNIYLRCYFALKSLAAVFLHYAGNKIHRTSIGNPIRGDEAIYYGVLRNRGLIARQ